MKYEQMPGKRVLTVGKITPLMDYQLGDKVRFQTSLTENKDGRVTTRTKAMIFPGEKN